MSKEQQNSDVQGAGDLQSKPTLDGRRISLADIQSQVTPFQPKQGYGAKQHWFKRFWAACNDFLAGMYTGESCAGTPHSERQLRREGSGDAEPDRKIKKDS